MFMGVIQLAKEAIKDSFKNSFIVKWAKWIRKHPIWFVILLLILGAITYQADKYIQSYVDEYYRLNYGDKEEEKDNGGLTFTQIGDNLYTLTGSVAEGDCNKIVPNMPDTFTVILESPGGNLAEGSCIASHLKIRNVTTVLRATPVFNEEGKEIYTPGAAMEALGYGDKAKGKAMCASACSLFFLAGDTRYLIGNVYLGIHGPSTPPEFISQMNPQQLESSAFKTASALLQLVDRLGVDPSLRLLFIQIPGNTMYWVNPNDFAARPALVTLATNYRDFWGFTATDQNSVY